MADKGAEAPTDSADPADVAEENHTTLTVSPASANKGPPDGQIWGCPRGDGQSHQAP